MDIQVLETGNGGDIFLKGNDLVAVTGVENMPYLGTFGGDANWWGNDLLFSENETFQFTSETNVLLNNVALTSGNRLLIEEAIKRDLQFLVDNVPNTVLTVRTQIISDNRLLIDVNFGGTNFYMLWNPTEQAAKVVPYSNPTPILIWTTMINSYAITEFDMVQGSSTVTVPCGVFDNDGEVATRMAYLNGTFAPANGLSGVFSFVDGRVYYVNGASEGWTIPVLPRRLSRACIIGLTVSAVSASPNNYQFVFIGAGSDMVVDWGDATDADFYHPTGTATPTHTYSDTSAKTIRAFHNSTLIRELSFSFTFFPYRLNTITGTIPASLTKLYILSHYNITASLNTSSLSALEQIIVTNVGVVSFSPNLFTGVNNQLNLIDLRGNQLSSTEVDTIFTSIVALSINTTVYSSATRVIYTNSQTPAAPPTAASLSARTALITAGWTINTD